ncbi:MAG: DNA alkylation repair protein [Flavobacteriaceae bacterium]|nr:DNA alkylation repair protein [Flavobacteriaceae bacterium]
MAELLKNIYSQQFFDKFTIAIKQILHDFDKTSFLNQIYDNEWEQRELKQRMRHIVLMLKPHLPVNYNELIKTVLEIIQQLQKNKVNEASFEWMFLPEFVELYGLDKDDFKVSIKAFESITQFTSCEFAVRPFIIKYPEQMISQMLSWSNHKHAMVRRLSSEGCRPRLPWAMAIPALKSDPTPIIPILENLKIDTSESVRRSVANNLNDISKDNPNTVIELIKKWKGKTKETDWLVKHASRTLLKQGNAEMMELFGFGSLENIQIDNLQILTPKIKIGEALLFTFQLKNIANSSSKIRLEYGLYYQKANGSLSRKVFTISEKEYPKNSTTTINRKQPFKVITTRKLHLGLHQLSLIINGKEFEKVDFKLMD